ncbi:hypothetical protein CHH55_01255 [Niallia circulans]|jgi:hypothetical protein|uniref:DUF4064 domain-containing protein n=1 Tax=Niallia circulans TaxID=1397 RepID=A0A0J1IQL1_NIACI|nr:hypothetical protein [Niallia circulans]KLV28247.1 hypothetical protein ABW02_00415 [Niallia circulans]MCM2979733.1 hypothetical protein [Niallia circulans]MDR4315653.1 hypothetical protein [Niallia circulans]MED3837101.1 hypothetical protein [Niallia circulans]MED4244171.1 hypothetical protein [Niallia circulans]
MNRKLERNLVRIVGVWQIIDGLITILLYGTLKKVEGARLAEDSAFVYMKAMESYVGSVYIFIGMFGALLIGLGLINLVCAKKYMIDDQVHVKVAVWLFVCGALSYIIMDIISLVLCMSAGILVLAKNKSIRKINRTTNNRVGGIN